MAPDLDQLYTAYKAGRPRAEDRLSAEVWRRVHGVLRMRGASGAEAEEFAQQVTARIMRNFAEKEVAEPTRYVARAATLSARDMGRRRASRADEVPLDPQAPTREVESVDAWRLSAVVEHDHAVAADRVARILQHPELTDNDRTILQEMLMQDASLQAVTEARLEAQGDAAPAAKTLRGRVDKNWQRARDRVLRLFSEWQAED